MLARICVFLLRRVTLGVEERAILVNALLDSVASFQSRDILYRDAHGVLIVNDKPVDYELAKVLMESARGALHNSALEIVHRQVEYHAVQLGMHKAETPQQMLFAKGAMWWGQEEIKLLKTLAGED